VDGSAPVRRPEDEGETYIFDTAEGLKALADPLRLRFLVLVADRPSTVKEAAGALGVPATRLYYHVKLLERWGLIEVTDRRLVSGIEERTYRAIASNWTMSPSLAASAISTSGVLRAVMNMARAEMEAVIHERPGEPMSAQTTSPLPSLGLTQLALGDDDLAEVERRLAALMEEFGALRAQDAGGKPMYHMLFAVYPVPRSLATEERE
jgi:DNA-binding transcriptional ArsR family regulator